jgi:cysteinyl-tRNA synthetase
MSKSKGNFYTIKDLKEQGWRGAEIRIALLSGHYRSSLNFSQKSLHQARVLVARIRNAKNLLEAYPHDGEMNLPIDHIKEKFQEALIGDLNTPEALALVSVLLKATMPTMQDGKLSQKTKDEVLDFFAEDVDPIFAIMTPDPDEMFSKEDVKTLEKLIKQRKTLRDEKKYDEADVIRVKIEALGAEVLDTPDGTLFRKAMGANPQT